GYGAKLKEVASKYGPQARIRRRENVKMAKEEIRKINNDLKNIPSLIAQKQQEVDNLKNKMNQVSAEFDNKIKRSEDLLKALNEKLESEPDMDKRKEIQEKEIKPVEQELQKLKDQKDQEIKNIESEIKTKESEIASLPQSLISKRRKVYEAIAHPEAFNFELDKDQRLNLKAKEQPGEPLTLFSSMVNGVSKYKASKKTKKAVKLEDLKKAGVSEEQAKKMAKIIDVDLEVNKAEEETTPAQPQKPPKPKQA
ncbi:MAG: hypothetical protein ACPL3E_00520, partial [Minisyncoccia bacterium]